MRRRKERSLVKHGKASRLVTVAFQKQTSLAVLVRVLLGRLFALLRTGSAEKPREQAKVINEPYRIKSA
jgi:hypothetical protein